jgi:class I fructose-bisphosphate aldolase/fructose-bisphosphate aldolase/2-amino-3,7-dideoxy-D-threo-hept-6-ulosonate synthase
MRSHQLGSPVKALRLSRFRRRGARAGLLVPIDHGLTMGPLDGIRSIDDIARWIGHPAVSGVIAHKGLLERLAARGLLDGIGVMAHLNGMSKLASRPDDKELVTSVRAAQRLGADAVSVQVNFDGVNDSRNLRLLGAVADAAQREGLPLLTMLYDKVRVADDAQRLGRLAHLIRVAVELGTDALKLAPPATARQALELPELLRDHAADTAFFFAGGSTCPDADLVALARQAVAAGAAGLCIGRNVFGRERPDDLLEALDRALNTEAAPVARLLQPVSEGGGSRGLH